MTRIAIFCDGTWNSPDISEPTHVVKMYEALKSDARQGQMAVYFKGIGTDERFDGPVRRFFNRWGGGAFGWGLDAKVKQAYQFIAMIYKPGDEIYLFGFSRGAYTARSVAGMIRKCGIVEDTSPDGINRAFNLYRKRGRRNHPDTRHIWHARREMSPRFATSQKDIEMRGDGSELVNIAYVGVWDTVGARGVPVAVLGPLAAIWNSQYKFHDMVLSSLVRSARHALALDEMRVFYTPAKWDNLDILNKGHTGDDPARPYQQIWFVGNHGIVGGSAETQQLASYTSQWVLDGARRLVLKPDAEFPAVPPDATVPSDEVAPRRGLFKRWRSGPASADETHVSVRDRVRSRPEYRPVSLKRLLPAWLSQ